MMKDLHESKSFRSIDFSELESLKKKSERDLDLYSDKETNKSIKDKKSNENKNENNDNKELLIDSNNYLKFI